MRRRAKIFVVAASVAVLLLVVGTVAIVRDDHRKIMVTAHFEDAVGLYAGNGVSVLGMQVGTVTSVVSKDSYVEVKMEIEKAIDIPADVQAVTVSNSILTDRHVELTPPYRGGATLKNGDVLGRGRTRTPVEFDRTLAMVDNLGKAMRGDANGGGPLGDLINISSDITAGNGPEIKATLDKLSQALRVGSDRGTASQKNIQEIVSSVSELTNAATENDAAIREFGSYLRQVGDLLAEQDLGAGSTGAKANQILEEATRLLEGNSDRLNSTFADADAITTTLTEFRRELEETLDVGPLAVDNLYNVIDPVAGGLRARVLLDKSLMNSQFAKEICNLMGLKQLGCATGTLKDYGPDLGLNTFLDLMGNGINGQP